jgi:hypothetical protein
MVHRALGTRLEGHTGPSSKDGLGYVFSLPFFKQADTCNSGNNVLEDNNTSTALFSSSEHLSPEPETEDTRTPEPGKEAPPRRRSVAEGRGTHITRRPNRVKDVRTHDCLQQTQGQSTNRPAYADQGDGDEPSTMMTTPCYDQPLDFEPLKLKQKDWANINTYRRRQGGADSHGRLPPQPRGESSNRRADADQDGGALVDGWLLHGQVFVKAKSWETAGRK